jgi:hypothetical protein
MKERQHIRRKAESGQVLTEYAIMLAMCAGVAIVLTVLLYYFSEFGWRVINLVCIDYP